jgi:hypothetical protein
MLRLLNVGRSYEKIHAELPLMDAKIKDFEKFHEDVQKNVKGILFRASLFFRRRTKLRKRSSVSSASESSTPYRLRVREP